ncbi:peroxiredoxin [Betaproteobacteria bacterium]|nr:peroxiredoxin [Betaproteobacteria bacterium]GHU45999.1 peroxiredoxin [Betaproteobacteria bacterium]
MKRKHAFTASLLIALCAPALVSAALPEGSAAPRFTARGAVAGKVIDYRLQDALSKGAVVVYFYPSAFTGGCNIQAHEFAVQYEQFVAAGATIVGVSLDGIERLKAFSADPDFCAGKITVVSDADGRIAKAYDISVRDIPAGRKDTRGTEIDHALAERTTFIIDKSGNITATVGGVSPVDNVAKTLEIVRRQVIAR